MGSCQKWVIMRIQHLWEQPVEMTVADDFSIPHSLKLSQMDCTKSTWFATNSALPLCCEEQSNTCELWCLLISQTDKAMFENSPFCSVASSAQWELAKFYHLYRVSPSLLKQFRAHSGHILLPRSQWGWDLIQSVHTKLFWKFSVACFIL